MTNEKFSSKMDARTLHALRAYAHEEGKPISLILTQAVTEYLHKVRIRPAYQNAAEAVLDEHSELLARLAK